MSIMHGSITLHQLPSDESGALRALYVLTDRLYRSQSVDEIYRAALDALQATLQCQRASILLFDDAGVMRFVAWRGLSDHYRKSLEGHSPWQRGAREAEPIFVGDIRESAEPEWVRATIEREGIRGLGFIPLMIRGEVVGKFMTYHDAPHVFAERDIGVAVHIARQVGFSLERQRADAERRSSEERLRESEERFRLMCEHAPVMIWMSHPDGSCLYLNRMLREFWSVDEDRLAAFSWADSMHPDDAPAIGKAMYDALQRRAPVSVKGRYCNAEGLYRTLKTDARPRFSASGDFLGMIGVNIDITEREEAEAQLRESEERLRLATGAAGIFSWESDLVTRRMTWSENAAALIGCSPADLPAGMEGGTFFVLEGDRLLLERQLEELAAQRSPSFSLSFRSRTGAGELRHWRTEGSIQYDMTGNAVRILGITQDVSAAKRTQLELETALASLEVTLDGADAAPWRYNTETRSVVWSPRGYQQLGYGMGEKPPSLETFLAHVHPADRDALVRLRAEEETAPEGTKFSLALRLVTADGALRWIERRSRAGPREGGGRVIYGVDIDISERKKAEEALRVNRNRLAAAFRIGRIGIYDYDLRQQRAVNWDRLVCDIWGVGEGEFLSDEIFWGGIHPQDIPVIERAVAAGIDPDGPRSYQSEYRVTSRADGQTRWVNVHAAVSFEGREAVGILGTVQDITERKQAEEHIRLLMREVNHRSKNLLAVVQAIASQTALKSEPRSFTAVFRDRIRSLAASHDLLVKNAWEGADLEELVCSQLSHFADLIGKRIFVHGKPIRVTPAAAQALGMALHELATNAGKYGSLSVAAGTVAVSWRIAVTDGARSFDMTWIEAGGPPVRPPAQTGFGTVLIAEATASALQGRVALEHPETGLRWSLSAPLAEVSTG